jgi:16S rRNA (cytosine1402-N4)-methyltransferase
MVGTYHEPVLSREVLSYLLTDREGIYIDATLGGGGHAAALLSMLGPAGRIIGFDRDADAIEAVREDLKEQADRIVLVHDVYSTMLDHLGALGIGAVHGILFDLGVSSHQIDAGERGFSYGQDAPLDMRMDRTMTRDAATVINTYDERDLADLIFRYGEEKLSRRIARRIVADRQKKPFATSKALYDSIRSVVGERYLIKTVARVFQALRIEVNAELEHLQKALGETPEVLNKGGRLVVISYHSLEDRIVKTFFRERSATSVKSEDPFARQDTAVEPQFRILTKKPVLPGSDEQARNPRSRSAKLRAVERCS